MVLFLKAVLCSIQVVYRTITESGVALVEGSLLGPSPPIAVG